jgi:hypothetical protein
MPEQKTCVNKAAEAAADKVQQPILVWCPFVVQILGFLQVARQNELGELQQYAPQFATVHTHA